MICVRLTSLIFEKNKLDRNMNTTKFVNFHDMKQIESFIHDVSSFSSSCDCNVAMIFFNDRVRSSMKSYKLHNFRFDHDINTTIDHDVE